MLEGGCDCGEVTFAANVKTALPYVCHCLRCQTRSGSAFSMQVVIEEADFTISGETSNTSRQSNGVAVEEVVCARCFTRLFNRNAGFPGVVLLYAGTLRSSDQLRPFAHIWTKRKQPWVALEDGIVSFSGSPTPEEFGGALMAANAASFSRS